MKAAYYGAQHADKRDGLGPQLAEGKLNVTYQSQRFYGVTRSPRYSSVSDERGGHC